MTREEIEKDYKVIGSTIISPGKFEGGPVYAPHFYDLGLNGCADEEESTENDDNPAFVFFLDASDVERWPELRGVRKLRLVIDGNGFVHTFRENY